MAARELISSEVLHRDPQDARAREPARAGQQAGGQGGQPGAPAGRWAGRHPGGAATCSALYAPTSCSTLAEGPPSRRSPQPMAVSMVPGTAAGLGRAAVGRGGGHTAGVLCHNAARARLEVCDYTSASTAPAPLRAHTTGVAQGGKAGGPRRQSAGPACVRLTAGQLDRWFFGRQVEQYQRHVIFFGLRVVPGMYNSAHAAPLLVAAAVARVPADAHLQAGAAGGELARAGQGEAHMRRRRPCMSPSRCLKTRICLSTQDAFIRHPAQQPRPAHLWIPVGGSAALAVALV